MDPSGRDQRRPSADRHHKPHSHHRQDDGDHTHGRRDASRAPVKNSRRESDDEEDDKRVKKTKKEKRPETKKGPIAKYGALLLAAGLGFGAGFLYSDGRNGTGQKHKAVYRPENRGRGRGTEDYPERQDRRRLEYRRSEERLALRGPSVRGRSISRSTRYAPIDYPEYDSWR